ncbi:hypothetical protein [Spiroplasma endosymbiont of Aspidapion aeneum]|uniref:hypothetical protein n=1 Tax=Spiroplasma endosymbiont of Aspidapion aeneum TaxID=3066276 RepID=UPI00313E8C3F
MYLDKYKNNTDLIFKIVRFNRVYDHRGYLQKSGEKRRDKYIKQFKHLDYISREIAALNYHIEEDDIQRLLYLKNNNLEKYYIYLEELSKKEEKHSGIYTKYGPIGQENISWIKNKIKNLDDNQNIWETILWFNIYIVKKSRLYNYKNINHILKNSLEYLFSRYMLKEKDLFWYYAIHINTNGFHIHLDILEDKKTLVGLDKNNNKINTYINFGMFKIDHINIFKNIIRKECDKLAYQYKLNTLEKQKWFLKTNLTNNNNIKDYDWNWFDVRQVFIDLKYKNSIFLKKSLMFIRHNYKNYDSLNNKSKLSIDNFDNQSKELFYEILINFFDTNNYLYDYVKNKEVENNKIELFLKTNKLQKPNIDTFLDSDFITSKDFKKIENILLDILISEIVNSNKNWKNSFLSFINLSYYKEPEVLKNSFANKLSLLQTNIEKKIISYFTSRNNTHEFKKLFNFENKIEMELEKKLKAIEMEGYISFDR